MMYWDPRKWNKIMKMKSNMLRKNGTKKNLVYKMQQKSYYPKKERRRKEGE